MKFNFKVWKANTGNKKAVCLAASQKHIVIDVNIEADNGNQACNKFYTAYDIKNNWQVKMTRLA